MKKTILIAFVLALALSGRADDPYAGYIYLTANDTIKDNSWNNTDATEYKQGHWSEAFATDRNYYVPAGKIMYVDGQAKDAGTWAGGELVVAGTLSVQVNRSNIYIPKIPNLVFLDNTLLRSTGSQGLFASPTRITVRATADKPLVIQAEYKDKGYPLRLFADLHGAADTGIRIQSVATATNSFYYATDTFSDFFGTLTVTGAKVNMMPSSNYFTMPGKLVVSDSAVFMPSDNAAKKVFENVLLGALAVTNSGVIAFRANEDDAYVTLGITNSVRIADGGKVRVDNLEQSDLVALAKSGAAADRRIAVRIANLSVDAPVNADVDDAKVTMLNEDYDRAFNWKLIVADKGDGTKDLYAGATNIATVIKSLANGPSLDSTECWAGGLPPTEGVDIYCPYRFNPFTGFDFSKSRLIFGSTGHYWRGSGTQQDLNAKEYHVLESTSITLWGGFSRRLRGGAFHLADGVTFAFNFMNDCSSTRLESEIVGNGSLMFKTYNAQGDLYRATLENLNTNWHGRLTMAGFLSKKYKYNTILGDARNWGGDFRADEDWYSAVTLASNTCVYVTNNVCFNDPTRGFLLKNAPGLMVEEGFTLTLSNQVTYAGVVTKSDKGVLELGGTAAFLPGSETGNKLNIDEGALKVSSTNAVDGLDVSFAAGTKLVVPRGSDGGFYNVKSSAPLTFADAKLKVEITGFEEKPLRNTEVTICTLNSTAGNQLTAASFDVVQSTACRVSKIEKRTTGDNVSFVATIMGRRGLIVTLK